MTAAASEAASSTPVRPGVVLLSLVVVLLPAAHLTAQSLPDRTPEAMPLLRKAARSMDRGENYTAQIKKSQETEITSRLYNRTRNITGSLQRTDDHILMTRTTKTTTKRGEKKNTKTKKTKLIGSPNPERPLLIKTNDEDWSRFREVARGDINALRKHIVRGVEARSVSMLHSAEITSTDSVRNTPCWRVSAVGSTDRIKDMISDVYQSLGGRNARVTIDLRKKSFTFWITRSNPRILKFTSDIQLLMTMRAPRSPGKENALQVLDTTYTFSDIGNTTIPEPYRRTYRERVSERD